MKESIALIMVLSMFLAFFVMFEYKDTRGTTNALIQLSTGQIDSIEYSYIKGM